jgi:hypothetical protein
MINQEKVKLVPNINSLIRDLTAVQIRPDGLSKYALFLPATSSFYISFIGNQRYSNYTDLARIPACFTHGVESLNYLDPNKGLFYYKWNLHSAGHADLDLTNFNSREDVYRNRDRTTSVTVADSGGYQIGKLRWKADWTNPNCPLALKKRQQVLTWMDSLMEYGMTLDIPSWAAKNPEASAAIGIATHEDAIQGTFINNDYFINNRNGNCKFLNVLQGENHADAEDWYQRMKKYCDPKIYGDRAFNGWAMGGQHVADVHLTLLRLIALRFDGLLERGQHDWMHFLGTSKVEWALLLTDIQTAIRKYHNPDFSISFDCASPFLAAANGQVYTDIHINDRKKWFYRMSPCVHTKHYYTDTRLFRDAVLADGIFPAFETSPVIEQMQMNDIFIYGPTNLNKQGKIGATSWDSFSYAILQSHNVYKHVEAVQRCNQAYESGMYPYMLVANKVRGKKFRQYDLSFFHDIVDAIFATSDRGRALALVEEYTKYWTDVVGVRGQVGQDTINASTNFTKFFSDSGPPTSCDDSCVLDSTNLDMLEDHLDD